jgi:hypothetical protein
LGKLTIEKARKEIEELIICPGEYGHNIISATLRIIAKEYGAGEANKLVEELNLEGHFGIPKWWPAIDMLKGKTGTDEWMGPTAARNTVLKNK